LTPQATQDGGEPLQLDIANSIWGQRNYEFAPSFLDTLALYYGAGLRLTDFAADPEAARNAINEWVKQQTKERIPELFAKGVIDEETRLVLANAIYFKAGWLFPFEEGATKDGPFHRLDGSEVRAPMMSLDMKQEYARLDHAQAVQLKYAGGNASMLVIVPDEGAFPAFEARLDASVVDSAVAALEEAQVELSMPKLDFASECSLSDALKALGMPSAFDGGADFSGMTAGGGRDLFIKDVVHKANITVDEQGTEAAAATGVVMESSAPSVNVELTIDRPFLFVIRDDETGLVLFAGRVLDPTAS
jgi:serpin B